MKERVQVLTSKQKILRLLLCIVLFTVVTSFVPAWWCGIGAHNWFDGSKEMQTAFARSIEDHIQVKLSMDDFGTGDELFDREWLFCTYILSASGFAQMAKQHPQRQDHYIKQMEICIEKLLSDELQEFDEEQWNSKAMETLDSDALHHGAYLAYLNFVLSLHRTLKLKSPYAKTNDLITKALVRRIRKNKIKLIETYPNEVYPPDNCLAFASIGLHAQATQKKQPLLKEFLVNFHQRYIDPKSGLIFQAVDSSSGLPIDEPRGSGTTFGLYFLSFIDLKLSKQLYQATKDKLAESILGFGVVREYLASTYEATGDVDSGPVVVGYGVSATGFMMAGARIHGDRDYFNKIYRTSVLFGTSLSSGGKWQYVTGGPLGNAIMFAMITAISEKVKK
ncbi:hypothetical protein [Candidatus Uabimicrobium sp. HlEnr_7]|uniref:hypothetical protein n=1 Tax=Candidatus Uabimicrobium helgolandensis TaxID=3095367 RepID=UPI00355778D1